MKQSYTARIGLMAGFLAMLYVTVLYISDPIMLVTGYERVTLLIFVGAMLYGMIQLRPTELNARSLQDLVVEDGDKSVDISHDFRSFSELLQAGFRIYFIGFLLKFTFIYLLFHYYDPSLIDLAREESVRIFMEQSNIENDTQEMLEQRLAQYRQGEFGPSLKDVLGIFIELVMGFIVAAVMALFFKRDQPDY